MPLMPRGHVCRDSVRRSQRDSEVSPGGPLNIAAAAAGHSFCSHTGIRKGQREAQQPQGRARWEIREKTRRERLRTQRLPRLQRGRGCANWSLSLHICNQHSSPYGRLTRECRILLTHGCLQKSFKPVSTKSSYGQSTSAEPLKSVRHASCP